MPCALSLLTQRLVPIANSFASPNRVNSKGTSPALTAFACNKTSDHSGKNWTLPRRPSNLSSRTFYLVILSGANGVPGQHRGPGEQVPAHSFVSPNRVNSKGTPLSLTSFVCIKISDNSGKIERSHAEEVAEKKSACLCLSSLAFVCHSVAQCCGPQRVPPAASDAAFRMRFYR